jgi:hypothetical protein
MSGLSHALFQVLVSGRAPPGLVVAGRLDLARTRIRSLPDGLVVDGDLDLRQCERFHRLGAWTAVGGDLRIGGPRADQAPDPGSESPRDSRDKTVPIRVLPSQLRVGGSLEVRHAQWLEELPDDIQIGRSLAFVGCDRLRRLPRELYVHGDFTVCGGRALRDLPDALSVEGHMRIVGTAIERLPARLCVGGDLTLVNCGWLTELGDPTVGGKLEIHGYRPELLPLLPGVAGDVKLVRAKRLRRIPDGWAVRGSLEASWCPELEAVGDGVTVGQDLRLTACKKLVYLPRGLRVGTLSLRGCEAIPCLPRGLRAKRIWLSDCAALVEVPPDLEVDEPVEVAGTSIREWPASLADKPVLWRGVRVPAMRLFAAALLDPQIILLERNAELRRVLLERAGVESVLQRACARVVDEDTDAGGPRRLVEVVFERLARHLRSEQRLAARYLLCRCPSTGRQYLLGVPPTVGHCVSAAAWLAGFDDPTRYRPVVET